MNDTQQLALELITRIANQEGVRLRSYSGRAMYGSYCLGLAMEVQALLTALLYEIAFNAEYQDKDKLYDELGKFCTDSLGYETIVYWPKIEYIEEAEEEEE